MQLCHLRTLQTDKLLQAHAVPWVTWVKLPQQIRILLFRGVEQLFQEWAASGFYPAAEYGIANACLAGQTLPGSF